jgi:hypothetical protein
MKSAEKEVQVTEEAIKDVLTGKSYEDQFGVGLTALEIAQHLGTERDLVTPRMTDLYRSGQVDYLESKRDGSKKARLYWLTGVEGTKPVKIKSTHSLGDRARALVKFILIMSNKMVVDDPVQDIEDIKEKAIELFPEF